MFNKMRILREIVYMLMYAEVDWFALVLFASVVPTFMETVRWLDITH